MIERGEVMAALGAITGWSIGHGRWMEALAGVALIVLALAVCLVIEVRQALK